MIRLPDWPERLASLVASKRDVPFEWGVNDCSTFAADAVEAVTGVRPHTPVVESAPAFAALIEKTPIAEIVDGILGERVEPVRAQRGDIVLYDGAHGPTLAVCIGASAASPAPGGIATIPMPFATAAWKV
ncbi:MAG: hypothetical protein KA761_00225 [Gemmatimonadaceae bacterium]|nr:hypothetical protein [Gemmatimonadaceae bacterium]